MDGERYDAFISYSHAADGRLAPALQVALQRFAKPWHHRRALRIFRDQTSLAASPELWPVIQDALDRSRYFVLLASPEAAQSRWVRREVAYWRQSKSLDRLLIVLTGGDLTWDEATNDFDWAKTNALPEELKGAFPSEPLWVDVRWAHGEEQLSLQHPRFLEAVTDLAAPLHGRAKEDLLGEDVRQHKRTVRLAGGAIAALALLLVAALVGAVIAVEQRGQAVAAGQLALARQLAAQAASPRTGDMDTRLLLAVEANRLNPGGIDAQGSLLDLLSSSPQLEAFLPGQRHRVDAIRFRPDGAAFATSGADGVVLWDATTRQRVAGPVGLNYGNEFRLPLAFSPDGRIVATSVRPGEISLLDGATLGEIGVLASEAPTAIVSLAFSPDGAFLAAAGLEARNISDAVNSVTVWDIAQRTRLATLPVIVNDLVFGVDSQTLVTVDADSIKLWDWREKKTLVSENVGYYILKVAVSPNRERVIFDGEEGAIEMRDTATLKDLGELPAPHPFPRGFVSVIQDIAYSPNANSVVAAGDDGLIYRWDVQTRELLGYPLDAHGSPVFSVTFSPDGDRLISGGTNGTVIIWNLNSGPRLGTQITMPSFSSVAVNSQGKLALGDANGRIHFWNLKTGTEDGEPLDASFTRIEALAFSGDGRFLASGDAVGTVRVWDGETRQAVEKPMADSSIDLVYAVAFLRDDQVVAAVSGEDGTIRFWDVTTGNPVVPTPTDEAGYSGSSLALSVDGRVLAEGTDLGIRLVDTATLEQLGSIIPGPADGGSVAFLTFSSDGRTLVASGQAGIVLVDAQSYEKTAELSLPQGGWVNAVAIKPGDALLASGGNDGSIRLWDVSSRQLIGQLSSWHRDWIRWLAFSPDGRFLVSNDNTGQAVIWTMDVDRWIAEACAIAGRNFTPEEWAQFLAGEPYRQTCAAWPAMEGSPTPLTRTTPGAQGLSVGNAP